MIFWMKWTTQVLQSELLMYKITQTILRNV